MQNNHSKRIVNVSDYQTSGLKEGFRILLFQKRSVCHNTCSWIDFQNGTSCRFDLQLAQRSGLRIQLAVDVGIFEGITVYENEPSNTASCKEFGNGAACAAKSDNGYRST